MENSNSSKDQVINLSKGRTVFVILKGPFKVSYRRGYGHDLINPMQHVMDNHLPWWHLELCKF